MASQSTIYDVQVNYSMSGNAGQGVKELGAAAEKAEGGLGGVKGAIEGVVAALGLVKAFEFGKKAFIDFNSMLEQSTVSIAAQEKLLKGGKWDKAMQNATELVSYYQQVAKASINTTEDFISMHRTLAGSGYRIGMSNDEIKQMTKGAILLSSAFGESAQYVGLEMKEMMSGIVNARQRIPAIILSSQNKTREEFAKMDAKAKRKLILTALNDPAFAQAAKAMEFTWKGVTSTLKDNIQIAMGKVGLPIFKAISNEVKGWNVWIEDNGQKLEEYGKKFGEGLISALSTAKEIAAALAPIAELGKNLGSEISSMFKEHPWLKEATGLGMLKRFGQAASGTAKGINNALYGSENYRRMMGTAGEFQQARRKEEKAQWTQSKLEAENGAPLDVTKDPAWQAAKKAGDDARQAQIEAQKRTLETGAAADFGIVSKTEANGLTTYAPTVSKEEATRQLVTDKIGKVGEDEIAARRLFIKTLYDDIFGLQRSLDFGEAAKKEDERAKKLSPEHAKVNVHIAKIEVASPDPDRFVMGMVRSFEQIVENPVTAASTLRGGF